MFKDYEKYIKEIAIIQSFEKSSFINLKSTSRNIHHLSGGGGGGGGGATGGGSDESGGNST